MRDCAANTTVINREGGLVQYAQPLEFDAGWRLLDARRSLSSGGHAADPLAGMTTIVVASAAIPPNPL
jgi:hypothetical protein